jgi:hypothetical protein
MVPAAALVCVCCREGDQCRLEKVEFDAEAISNLISPDSLHSPFTSSSRLKEFARSSRLYASSPGNGPVLARQLDT